MKRCCDIRLPFQKKKATKFHNIFFLGREGEVLLLLNRVFAAADQSRLSSVRSLPGVCAVANRAVFLGRGYRQYRYGRQDQDEIGRYMHVDMS